MKTITTSAHTTDINSTHYPALAGMRFGDGFRQFLASAPREDEAPWAIVQPTRFLEAVPMNSVDPVLDRKLNATHQSIARCLTTSLLMAARPTRRSPSLADAVAALKHASERL